ncbi:hypothetical protein NHX12_021697, partial [Muraenolepis orangiensis]
QVSKLLYVGIHCLTEGLNPPLVFLHSGRRFTRVPCFAEGLPCCHPADLHFPASHLPGARDLVLISEGRAAVSGLTPYAAPRVLRICDWALLSTPPNLPADDRSSSGAT